MAHPDNRFYGHNRALLRSAGASELDVVHGHIQHGWMPGSGLLSRSREVPWLPKLVWNAHNAHTARAEGHQRVTPIGAPFIYLDDDANVASSRDRTLVYPHHSWEKAEMQADHSAYIAQIIEREGSSSVSVCLYWREYDDASVRMIYEEAGFRVICHGRRENPQFLERVRAEMLAHSRVVSNHFGSALWYAGHMGRNIGVYGPLFVVQATTAEAQDAYHASMREWPELYSSEGLGPESARELADIQLGREYRRSPEELHELCRLGRRRLVALWDRWSVHVAHDVLAAASLTQRAGSRARRE